MKKMRRGEKKGWTYIKAQGTVVAKDHDLVRLLDRREIKGFHVIVIIQREGPDRFRFESIYFRCPCVLDRHATHLDQARRKLDTFERGQDREGHAGRFCQLRKVGLGKDGVIGNLDRTLNRLELWSAKTAESRITG